MGQSRFFDLYDDMSTDQRWHLGAASVGAGASLAPNVFTSGRVLPPLPTVQIALHQPGPQLDFTLADGGVPVVSLKAARAVAEVAGPEVQLIPARVPGADGEYAILNATRTIDCLDEAHSGVSRWKPGDGRPEMIGKLFSVGHVRIRPEPARDAHFFRVAGWEVALIVSDRVRKALLDVEATGAAFRPVSPGA